MEQPSPKQSHAGQRHILDLPDELLCEIFDYFRPDDVDVNDTPFSYLFDDETRDAGQEDLAVLQSARLVCRRFHDIASPLLVPVLRASIDPDSLRRIDGLTRNPHITSGVRLIQLLLGYRPIEASQTFVRYRDLQVRRISRLCTNCHRYLDFPDPDDEFMQVMQAAAGRYSYLLSAWDECTDPGDDGWEKPWPADDPSRFKEFLYECYDEYRRRQEDQDRVLADGSYVAALAASAGRMTGLRALSFSDHYYSPIDSLTREELARPGRDTEKLREMMVMPLDWATIERQDPVPALLPARLLWEVPIALFEGGVRLQEVAVSTLPLRSNSDMLRPLGGPGEAQPAWERLRAAFSNLRRVDVGRLSFNLRFRRPGPLPTEDKSNTEGYLAALLSGEALQRMDFDARGLEFAGDNVSHPALGSVLASARHLNLRKLHIEDVSVLRHEMEAFIGGLGDGLRSVSFWDVAIRDGSWQKPLELLREKIARSGPDVDVSLVSLEGEGMDFPDPPVFQLNSGSDSDSEHELFSGDEESGVGETLFRDMERYVRGEEGIANPLSR